MQAHKQIINWLILFSIILWLLWKHRCKWVFQETDVKESLSLDAIMDRYREWMESPCIIPQTMNTRPRATSWEPPTKRFKINVDGSKMRKTGVTANGGVIRDTHGA